MRKCTTLILLSFLSIAISFGQVNLVPNPSIEANIACDGQLFWIDDLALPWFNPTNNSPDYFNMCQNLYLPGAGVPNNFVGAQFPKSGDGYGGLTTFYPAPNGREYISCPLVETLKDSQMYCIDFYVSLADEMKWTTKIGIAFTENNPSSLTIYTLHLQPQLVYPDSGTIQDTTNWVEVSGSFIAQGGERYLTIGNFFEDAQTVVDTPYPNNSWFGAYYYIDDVSVYECKADTDTLTPPIIYQCNITAPTLLGVNEQWQIINPEPQTSVNIYNLLGQKVFTSTDYDNDFVPPVAGVYLFELQCANGTRKKGKIVVMR